MERKYMHEPDEEIIKKSQNGDLNCFEKIYLNYCDKVYNICYRMTGNKSDAEDLTQDIFLIVFNKIKSYNFKSSFSGWFFKIATNTCIDKIRRKRKFKFEPIDNMNVSSKKNDFNLDEKIEVEKNTQDALNCLRPVYKVSVILKDMQGYSYKDIASFLRVSEGTVKSWVSRARSILRDKLRG
jgi:RNA polymerase sigma-70 factor (ECF subfamily)